MQKVTHKNDTLSFDTSVSFMGILKLSKYLRREIIFALNPVRRFMVIQFSSHKAFKTVRCSRKLFSKKNIGLSESRLSGAKTKQFQIVPYNFIIELFSIILQFL